MVFSTQTIGFLKFLARRRCSHPPPGEGGEGAKLLYFIFSHKDVLSINAKLLFFSTGYRKKGVHKGVQMGYKWGPDHGGPRFN